LSFLWFPLSPSSLPFAAHNAHVLLVTAHPDDECMFFAPTILALVARSVSVYSLCLSVGDAEGLGATRHGELYRSFAVLGVPSERVFIVDHPQLRDNFTSSWAPDDVAYVVRPYLARTGATAILTFDDYGISGHPNHISLPSGISKMAQSMPSPRPRIFNLVSISIAYKYRGVLDAISSRIKSWACGIIPTFTCGQTFASDIRGYWLAVQAMLQHKSQLVWFRWLYVAFSRYMWVNDWVEVS